MRFSLSLSLTIEQAAAYARRNLPERGCCATPQRRLAFLPPAHLRFATHAFPVADCTNCGETQGLLGWRERVWNLVFAGGWDGRLHLAEPAVWIDPKLARWTQR